MTEVDIIETKQVPCLADRRIDDSRYQLRERIGSGGYSVVYLAIDLQSPWKQVAVKCLLHETGTQKLKALQEFSLHKRAAHIPGVVKIHRIVEEGGLLFIVMEYCSGGDLFTLITDKRIFLGRDDLIKTVYLQLLDTVRSLHEAGIYHRDLKPENILCQREPHTDKVKLLLADFGLATQSERSDNFGCGSYFYMTPGTYVSCLPLNSPPSSTTMSFPENLAGYYSSALSAFSSRAADIWALGIILINMITSRSPWKCAMSSDPSFHKYTRDRSWLRQMLPLSKAAYKFVDQIFANHGHNLSLTELRAQFLRIDTFYMSGTELAIADKTARLVARGWIPETPVDDIKQEEVLHTEDVNEAALFGDDARDDSGSSVANSISPVSSGSTLTGDLDSPSITLEEVPLDTTEYTDDGSLSRSSSCSTDSDFPITPETRPLQVDEAVPDLPEDVSLGENIGINGNIEDLTCLNKVTRDGDVNDTTTIALLV